MKLSCPGKPQEDSAGRADVRGSFGSVLPSDERPLNLTHLLVSIRMIDSWIGGVTEVGGHI